MVHACKEMVFLLPITTKRQAALSAACTHRLDTKCLHQYILFHLPQEELPAREAPFGDRYTSAQTSLRGSLAIGDYCAGDSGQAMHTTEQPLLVHIRFLLQGKHGMFLQGKHMFNAK